MNNLFWQGQFVPIGYLLRGGAAAALRSAYSSFSAASISATASFLSRRLINCARSKPPRKFRWPREPCGFCRERALIAPGMRCSLHLWGISLRGETCCSSPAAVPRAARVPARGPAGL